MKSALHHPILLIATLSVALAAVAAEDDQRSLTPLDLSRIQSMESAVISPDGTTIAAVRSIPRKLFEEEDGKNWEELYLIDHAGSGARPFVTGEVNVSAVAWRPGSSAVSFLAQRGDDEHQRLYVIPTDGGEATPVLTLGSAAQSYDWSPDGSRVAVVASQALSKEEEELAEHGFDQEVFEEDTKPAHVFIADLKNGGEAKVLDLGGSVVQVKWGPGGHRLAVAVAPTSLVDDRYMYQRVHVVEVDTGLIVASIEREGKLGAIKWSPDGTRLAMISAADLHDPSASSLLVAAATGGSPENLTSRFEGSVAAFAWSDDDTLIALADVGVGTELYRVAASGRGRPNAMGRFDDGVVYTSLTLADDGIHGALIGNSPSYPDEVFALHLESHSAPVRLTDANPWLAQRQLAPQEIIRHEVRDGLELEGILLRPMSSVASEPAPLVMIVHGGPEGHRRNGWLTRYSAPAQILAARGYAVFFPNYRGSTGRGVEFSKLGQQDAAGAEFDDLVDAADHLVEIGVADADRLGVTGGSYGGYATAWLATRYSERFAAGVMFVGISNKISKFGTTDIPEEETLVHALYEPWDRWEYFLERSPIYHVEKGATPLLIMGGDADPRVSPTQSSEMYRALKTLGRAPVRLVKYPGEGHGNRRAGSRFDYQLRLLRWFDHYLMGPGGDLPPHRLDYRSPDHGWEPAVEE